MNPKPRKHFANGGLCRIERSGRARETALAQDNAQHLEIPQSKVHTIRFRHDHHSRFGMATSQRLCNS
jgi:hypothetical protein